VSELSGSTTDKKMTTPEVAIGLVHWPCWNQHGEVVCTNVTNFDIHDIARSSRAFGISRYYIINRIQEQLMFVARVLDHWRVGEGSEHNPMRKTAIEQVRLAETVEAALADYNKVGPPEAGQPEGGLRGRPLLVATSAQNLSQYPNISFSQLRERIWHDRSRPTLILFGTGWGLTDTVLKQCDYILDPIKGSSPDDYRHLSVRSAVAICLDRLLGQ